MKETWKSNAKYSNYLISNLGRIKNIKTGVIRKPQTYTKGYYSIRINGKNLLIHRLVAETFIENIENKPIVDHIDGDRKNNAVSNLRWVTVYENLMGHGHEERSNFHRIGIKAINVITKEEINFKSKTECLKYFGQKKQHLKTNYLYKQRNKKNWIFYITKKHKSK